MKLTTRDILASVPVEENGYGDNLLIVFGLYFSEHRDRLEGDAVTENDDNHYWGDWACRKTDEALDLIADAITKGRLS